MRKYLAAAWLTGLAGMLWLDHRWGPTLDAHDRAAAAASAADLCVRRADWDGAIAGYEKMLGALPDDPSHRSVRLQVALAENAAAARAGRQLESIKLLEDAVRRLDGDPVVAPAVLGDVRRELGTLHYYNAWLLRVQGAPAALWTGEAERARQQFRHLAGLSLAPVAAREADARNVERVLRLERLDLRELRGRKLPKQAKGLDQQPADQQNADQNDKTRPKELDRAIKVPPTNDLGRPGNAGFISKQSLIGS